MGLLSRFLTKNDPAVRRRRVPNDAPAETTDEHKRKARRRLLGSIALLLTAIIVLPMILDDAPKPVSEDIALIFPSKDSNFDGNAPVVRKPTAKLIEEYSPKSARKVLSDPDPDMAGAVEEPVVKSDANPGRKSEHKAAAKADAATESKPEAKAAIKVPPPDPAPKSPVKASGVTVDSPNKSTATDDPIANLAKGGANAKTTATATRHWVQVGAFGSTAKAREVIDRLLTKGHTATMETTSSDSGSVIRIRIGPQPDRDAAVRLKDQLAGEGFTGAIVQ
ncbi:MAG: SPOR domain-containing protein [Burkholderiaceae bacterium]|jgi:DedD protein